MNKLFTIIFYLTIGITLCFSQQTEIINFSYSLPENSLFKMKFKIDNNGTMKIRGTEAEMAAMKKAGYNSDRKVQYSLSATISMKTQKKMNGSLPFQFTFDQLEQNINSDGKKNNQSLSLSDFPIAGEFKNGQYVITSILNVGNAQQEAFIKSLPKNFISNETFIPQIKIGEQFTIKKEISTNEYKSTAQYTYTLKSVENNIAIFDIKIKIIPNTNNKIKTSGQGSGIMRYNIDKKYVISESSSFVYTGNQQEKTYNITGQSTAESSLNIELLE
ncbi:hypothetical protein C8J95_101282 [Elizabethkingia sp. YR214]|nr:hypothetical protein C8J95_101282 [Elizabethkingia sp. YR214]